MKLARDSKFSRGTLISLLVCALSTSDTLTLTIHGAISFVRGGYGTHAYLVMHFLQACLFFCTYNQSPRARIKSSYDIERSRKYIKKIRGHALQ